MFFVVIIYYFIIILFAGTCTYTIITIDEYKNACSNYIIAINKHKENAIDMYNQYMQLAKAYTDLNREVGFLKKIVKTTSEID